MAVVVENNENKKEIFIIFERTTTMKVEEEEEQRRRKDMFGENRSEKEEWTNIEQTLSRKDGVTDGVFPTLTTTTATATTATPKTVTLSVDIVPATAFATVAAISTLKPTEEQENATTLSRLKPPPPPTTTLPGRPITPATTSTTQHNRFPAPLHSTSQPFSQGRDLYIVLYILLSLFNSTTITSD